MSPEQIYIYTVYQEGSFSRAAQKLFITQPALSIAVKKVEDAIGLPIFDRTKKPLSLTDAGRIYIEAIMKIQLMELERDKRLNDIRNLETGLIRIGGTHYLNSYILPPYLVSFSRQYPGIKLDIEERSSFETARMLAGNEVDLTFSCSPSMIRHYPCYPMFEDHIVLAVPPAHPFNEEYREAALSAEDIVNGKHLESGCRKISIHDTKDLEIIILRKGNNLRERVLEMYHNEGLEPRAKLDLNQLVTAFHLAEAGLGANFTCDKVVRATSTAIFYALDNPLATREFYVLTPREAYISVAVQKMIELLRCDK